MTLPVLSGATQQALPFAPAGTPYDRVVRTDASGNIVGYQMNLRTGRGLQQATTLTVTPTESVPALTNTMSRRVGANLLQCLRP
jgi:hypothetical protein